MAKQNNPLNLPQYMKLDWKNRIPQLLDTLPLPSTYSYFRDSSKYSEVHAEPSQISKMKLFSENSEPFSVAISAKSSILDVWLGSEYASGIF